MEITGKEMLAQAKREIFEEKQKNHINLIKQQLKNISKAVESLCLAQQHLKEEEEKLAEMETVLISE